MALFFRQDIEKSPPQKENSFVGKLADKIRTLPESVPQSIRKQLSDLTAEINGESETLKTGAEPMLTRLKEKARDVSQKYILEGKTAVLKGKKESEKVLQHAKSYDDIRAGDILRMRKNGENLANYFLTDDQGEEVELSNKSLDTYKNKNILINFGNNKSINANIGLGDILPHEAKKVEVTDTKGNKIIGTLGTQDSRRGRRERVGYYDESGKYIAVYHGYFVRILETGSITKEEREKLESISDAHLKDIRVKEMMNVCIAKNGYKKVTLEEATSILSSEFPDEKDQELFSVVSEKLNDRIIRGEHIREVYKDGIGSRDKFIGKFGWYFRDIIGKDFPNIPPHHIVNLIQKESNFNPQAISSVGAYGFGQIKPETWSFIEERSNRNLDKESPYDQIWASAYYLHWIMKEKSCDIVDAIIYYHMGHNVDVLMKRNDREWLEKYKNANKKTIVALMTEDTWQGYWNAARKYYIEDTTLLTSLDLSKSGTELATKLGDFVMSTSLPNTGSSSCGAAVGELLNRFGFENLPQSGRDGKNWTYFLDARPQQFKKVPIKHPDEANAGAILVYDGSGDLGSDKNKLYGHVEVKGSDMKYYSYYEGYRAGGSAANNEKNPEVYRKLTGFTGFAYYPIQKQA